MTHTRTTLLTVFIPLLLTSACEFSEESEPGQASLFEQSAQTVVIKGVPVTGPNRFCDTLLWSFEDQDIAPLDFPQVGAFVPGQERPDDLSGATCVADQILATIHDPVLSTDPPGPAPAIVPEPDVRLQNIPLRDVPKAGGAFSGGLAGVRLLGQLTTESFQGPFPVYSSAPQEHVTLGKWAEARGKMRYQCNADGTAYLDASFDNLIANGLYSLWGIWRTPTPDGGVADVPAPFGGIPNAVSADGNGRARLSRTLPHCPSVPTANDSLVLWVTLAYHSDSALYGGVPDAGAMTATFVDTNGEQFESPLGLMMHHEQLAFPVNFTTSVAEHPAVEL